MTCDLRESVELAIGEMPDYSMYYVLAHYHQWGDYFKLSYVGNGPERTIFEITTQAGEPLGATIDPPISSQGATGLRLTCGYTNDTDETLTFGFQDKEMCVFLAYIDAPVKIGVGSGPNTPMGPNEDGVFMHEAECGDVVALHDPD